MKKFLLVTVALWASPVFAADMPVKSLRLEPQVHDTWAGFYIGVNGGYGWANYRPEITGIKIPSPFDEFKLKGWVFGGHAGYNWQVANWVLGFEVDYSGSDIDVVNSLPKGPSISAKVESFGSVRARVGYAIMPGFLLYTTGGLGLINASANAISGNMNFAADSRSWSWVAGVGGELKLTPNIILRTEYLHFDGGHANFAFGAPISQNVLASGNIDIVRAGISYKFGS